MIRFAEPSVIDIVDALSEAVQTAKRIVPNEMHARMCSMYDWMDVAKRTELVYNDISFRSKTSLGQRLIRYMSVGPFSGIIACAVIAMKLL